MTRMGKQFTPERIAACVAIVNGETYMSQAKKLGLKTSERMRQVFNANIRMVVSRAIRARIGDRTRTPELAHEAIEGLPEFMKDRSLKAIRKTPEPWIQALRALERKDTPP